MIEWVSRAASRDEANDLVSARPLLVFDKRVVPDNGFGKRIALVDKDCFRRDRRPDLVVRVEHDCGPLEPGRDLREQL